MSLGDCYKAAAEFVIANAGRRGIKLVHGEVTGQGAIAGVRFGHAWVEAGGVVIDPSNGRMVCMSKCAYYELGKIGDSVKRYKPKEACRWMASSRHYGPWENTQEKWTEYQHPTGPVQCISTPDK